MSLPLRAVAMLSLIVTAGAAQAQSVSLDSYREMTRAEIPCERPNDDNEIVVCALRDADKYRVPFIAASAARDSLPLRETKLTNDYSVLPCGQRVLYFRCGMVGVTVGITSGGQGIVRRPLAP